MTLASACNGGSDDVSPYDSELLGVYSIVAWTENPDSCDAEGPSVLEPMSKKFAIVRACAWETTFMQVLPCFDEATCATKTCAPIDDDAEVAFYDYGGWPFLRGNDADGWHAESFDGARGSDDCVGDLLRYELTAEGDELVLVTDRFHAGEFPADATPGCKTSAARAAVEGKPCDSREVVRFKRI